MGLVIFINDTLECIEVDGASCPVIGNECFL